MKAAVWILSLCFVVVSFQNCGEFVAPSVDISTLSSNEEPVDAEPIPTQEFGLLVESVSTEQGQNLEFDVRLREMEAPIVLTYETIDSTAVSMVDYAESRGTLTLLPGDTEVRVSVPTLTISYLNAPKTMILSVIASQGSISESQMAMGRIQPIAELVQSEKVATGGGHSCAITPNFSVKCWGSNSFGQLGNNSNVSSLVPVDVVGLTGVKSIALGYNHSCALTVQGAVKCWGQNVNGQLGNGDTVSSPVPVDVVGLVGAKSIVPGLRHTCAITAQDTVQCWGQNNSGQLGDGSTVDSLVPVDVVELMGVKAVSIGAVHSCAITAQDTVKCWGRNADRQLGNANIDGTVNQISAVPVDVLGLTGVKSISAGTFHTCVTTALDSVSCWGRGVTGQLGNNTRSSSSTPVDTLNLSNVKSVSSGGIFSCAITAQDTVRCWGSGDGISITGLVPIDTALTPSDVAGLTNIRSIYVGFTQACAATIQNELKCWGRNNFGQLGNNQTTDSISPVDVLGYP